MAGQEADRNHGRCGRDAGCLPCATNRCAGRESFRAPAIPRWTATDAFRAFIVAYGKLLPLRKASPFGEPAMIQTLIMHSSGVTGRVTWLLGRARGTGDREWQ
jgi:hypothetical protein